jgi:hypothetical protein
MVDKLASMLPSFPGTTNHTRCFLHTVNLVAKSLIREFDTTKKDADKALEEDTEDTSDTELSADTDNATVVAEYGDSVDGDNDEGWVDEVGLLSDRERNELEREIRPVKLVLVKVSQKIQCAPSRLICQYSAAQACI